MKIDFNTLKKICQDENEVYFTKYDCWQYSIPSQLLVLHKDNDTYIDIYDTLIKNNLITIDNDNYSKSFMRKAFAFSMNAVFVDYYNIQNKPYLIHHCLTVGDLIDYRFYKRIDNKLYQFKMAFIVELNDDKQLIIRTFDTNLDFVKACKDSLLRVNKNLMEREYLRLNKKR
ncbi:hypothetical protein [Paenimyroides baculatum]|uniref:Uncharacterized protein n=1 Tax=Paenimyroides baculatum TaxID=2608000 RepID=A0A5M6CLY3_9FLAO|nr:hypothetical protein [Paenimyroides baculatum]KAA5534325.1 hypothetical protein F0460_09460 [Paenimyroides baculatum]